MLKTLAILFALVVVLHPTPTQAAFTFIQPQNPFCTSTSCEEQQTLQQECEAKTNATQTATWDSTTEYCSISQILCPSEYYLGIDNNCYPEPSIAAAVATTTTATTTADQQSEIVKLLQQLIALEKQLVQLQSGK